MSAGLWAMVTVRDEGVDAECGLLTAAGRRTTQEHRNIRHVMVLRELVWCSGGQHPMLIASTCATEVVGCKRDRTTYTM